LCAAFVTSLTTGLAITAGMPYRDGVPIAVQVGGEAQLLESLPPGEEWTARNVLLRSPVSPALHHYLH